MPAHSVENMHLISKHHRQPNHGNSRAGFFGAGSTLPLRSLQYLRVFRVIRGSFCAGSECPIHEIHDSHEVDETTPDTNSTLKAQTTKYNASSYDCDLCNRMKLPCSRAPVVWIERCSILRFFGVIDVVI
jgi:hypothetical protein